jgi:hypothetical protein
MSKTTEEATFLELKTTNQGQVLVLLDGRKLLVNPGCVSTAVCWSPTVSVEISEGEGFFSVNVRNTMYDQVIRGRCV